MPTGQLFTSIKVRLPEEELPHIEADMRQELAMHYGVMPATAATFSVSYELENHNVAA
jgi:hypothetical protein